jgi:hypothetical protein
MGNLPTHNLLSETTRLLETLTWPYSAIPQTDNDITEEEFQQTYKHVHEATSSFPFGRHVGHYKAILKDPPLVTLHTTMMSLPFKHGFIPDQWTRVTDIMLCKEDGNARCHRLRIIPLFESYLNQAKLILIGRKLTHHLEDSKLLPSMQFGSRPGQQCQSAVLQKVLSQDSARLTRTMSAFIENDVIGCYDRLVNNLILLLLQHLGFAKTLCSCLGKLWDSTTHYIKTAYGTSSVTYCSTPPCHYLTLGRDLLLVPHSGSSCFLLLSNLWIPAYQGLFMNLSANEFKSMQPAQPLLTILHWGLPLNIYRSPP